MAVLEPKDYFDTSISCRVDLKIVSAINEKLSKKNQVKFNNSCFGDFMKLIQKIQFQGQLILLLLFKQAKHLRRDKLVFHVNNAETEFGPNEFALITGLHFGHKPSIPQTSIFFKKVWGTTNPEYLVVQDIEEAFCDDKHKGDGEVSLKLAYLWVLYGITLPKEKTKRRIDMEYVHLVDNLDEFNKYPWGSFGYELLVRDIRKILYLSWFPKKGAVRKKKQPKRHIDLHGFTYVLQFWSYEVIPCVGNFCVHRMSDDVIPHMLRWKATTYYRFTELTLNCFPSTLNEGIQHTIVLPNLNPSSKEESTTYYKSVMDCSAARTAKTMKRKRTDGYSDIDVKFHDIDSSDFKSPQVNKCEPNKSEEKIILNDIVGAIGKFNQKHMKIDNKLDRILENQRVIMARLGCFEHEEGIEMIEFEKVDEAHEEATVQNSSFCQDESEIDAYTTNDDDIEHKPEDIKVRQGKFYNPLSIEPLVGVDSVFMNWFLNKTSPSIHLSVGEYPETNMKWFERIWNPRGWLCSEDLDALIYLVVYKSKKWPKLFLQGWTVVDFMFWGHITGGVFKNWSKGSKMERAEYDWANEEKFISDYVLGKYPLHGPHLPWSQTERVFGVAHVNKNHWVLYEICIADKVITVYDSLVGGNRRSNPRHLNEIRKIAMQMPSIYKNLMGGECNEKTRSWEVISCPDTPQQNDSDSCGIFCIKILECLACGRSITEIDPEMIDEYRKRYCYELFQEDNIKFTG